MSDLHNGADMDVKSASGAEMTHQPGVALRATADVERIEAPVTLKAYFLCAFGKSLRS